MLKKTSLTVAMLSLLTGVAFAQAPTQPADQPVAQKATAEAPQATTGASKAQALPAGHPAIKDGQALPPGHPPIEGMDKLPAGHPPIDGMDKLPAGHPPIDGMDKLPAGHPKVDGQAAMPAGHPAVKGQGMGMFKADSKDPFELGMYALHQQDFKKAYEQFEVAAKAGNAQAQNNLGMMALNGLGTKADTAAAVKWFEAAAQQKNNDALFNLAELYKTGNGVQADEKKAVELYTQAAELGNPKAQFVLGFLYLEGNGGFTRDVKKATQWFEKVCQAGDPYACDIIKEIQDKKMYLNFRS